MADDSLVNVPREQREREARQFARMIERLRAFRAGELDIGKLISDLEGLMWALELASQDWIDAFQSEWGELEIAYAVALDRGEPIPDNSDPRVQASVEALLEVVEERLSALSVEGDT
jgi:hypothetical protein